MCIQPMREDASQRVARLIMKSGVLISVIVPVYNTALYLDDCIQSVMQQSYDNWQLILINDGSTDNSGEICDKWCQKDQRICVEHHTKKGLGYIRNRGIALAKGECVAFLDSDDVYHRDFLEVMYNIMKKESVDIVQCNIARFKDGKRPPSQQQIENIRIELLDGQQMNERIYTSGVVDYTSLCNKLFKKYIFDRIQFPLGKIHEDTFVSFKLYYLVEKVAVISSHLYFYRYRQSSIMTSKVTEHNFDMLDAFEERLRYYQDIQDSNLYGLCLEKYMYSSIVLYSKAICDNENLTISSKIYERAKKIYCRMQDESKLVSGKEKRKADLFIRNPKVYCFGIQVLEISKKVKNRLRSLVLRN